MFVLQKVFLGVGHGGSDPGAVGYVVEKVANLEMAIACRDYLLNNNVDVLLSRTGDWGDSLESRIKKCNNFKPNLAIDIHNNAGAGDGFEVYYHYKGGTSLDLAKNLEKEVISIGQNSRGLKTKLNTHGTDYFGFIRETICPAVIVEGFFVDNKEDSAIADVAEEQRKFGVAYAKAILKTLGVKEKETDTKENLYYVQAGAFAVKANADKLLDSLKQKGFNSAFIKQNF